MCVFLCLILVTKVSHCFKIIKKFPQNFICDIDVAKPFVVVLTSLLISRKNNALVEFLAMEHEIPNRFFFCQINFYA